MNGLHSDSYFIYEQISAHLLASQLFSWYNLASAAYYFHPFPSRLHLKKPRNWSVTQGCPSPTRWVLSPLRGCRWKGVARSDVVAVSTSVCGQSAVLPQQSQHPDGEVPSQPPRHQQHLRGQLQQQSLAEERGGHHLPRPAQGARRLPDVLRREISQPGDWASRLCFSRLQRSPWEMLKPWYDRKGSHFLLLFSVVYID